MSSPLLLNFYEAFLDNEDSAHFLWGISNRYSIATLERLASMGDRVTRRAAVMALSLMGDFRVNATLGRALHDEDRGVRLIAENGIQEIWCREGNDQQQQELRVLARLNALGHFEQVIDRAGRLLRATPWIAEAWNQRAIARYQCEQFAEASQDCHQALELNPYHFAAAVGMGNCYLELNRPVEALECFQRALRLNPAMESVRAQVEFLQRSL